MQLLPTSNRLASAMLLACLLSVPAARASRSASARLSATRFAAGSSQPASADVTSQPQTKQVASTTMAPAIRTLSIAEMRIELADEVLVRLRQIIVPRPFTPIEDELSRNRVAHDRAV